MYDWLPRPEKSADCNDLFNRTGAVLDEAFTYARHLGIKTCVGTEIPLEIPERLKNRLEYFDMSPTDPETITRIYKGIFQRANKAYPLDYYWLWTPEEWTWQGTSEEQEEETITDLNCALEAVGQLGDPFKMATCGWVLGPPDDRDLFDEFLPNDVTMSCISRFTGKAPLESSLKNLENRPAWAIPWLEDDAAFCCYEVVFSM